MSERPPIERYLDELAHSLALGRRSKRRILRELEAHLLEAVAESREAGVARAQAEREAIERLGPAPLVAARFNRADPGPRRRHTRVLAGAVALALIGGAGAGLVFSWGGGNASGGFTIGPPRPNRLLRIYPDIRLLNPSRHLDPRMLTPVTQATVPLGRLALIGRTRPNGRVELAPLTIAGDGTAAVGEFSPIAAGSLSLRTQASSSAWELVRLSYPRGTLASAQVVGGTKPRSVSQMAVLGLARADVAQVAVVLASGRRVLLPVSASQAHGFAYRSRLPSAFPVALEAYGKDGRRLERVPLERISALCQLRGSCTLATEAGSLEGTSYSFEDGRLVFKGWDWDSVSS